MKRANDAASRCLSEMAALHGAARVALAKSVSNSFLHELVTLCSQKGELGRLSAEAVLEVLALGITELNLAADRKGKSISEAASVRVNWPVLLGPLKREAESAANRIEGLGVGRAAMLRVGVRHRGRAVEANWIRDFLATAVVCRLRGWKEAHRIHRIPAPRCKALAALPDYDGSPGCFQAWADAMWRDVQSKWPGESLRIHPDWAHLPGSSIVRGVSYAQPSRIEARLRRRLRQDLRIT